MDGGDGGTIMPRYLIIASSTLKNNGKFDVVSDSPQCKTLSVGPPLVTVIFSSYFKVVFSTCGSQNILQGW